MGIVISAECSLCKNTGSDESAVWTEITLAQSLTMNDSMGEANISSRASIFEFFTPGMRTISIDFSVLADRANTAVAGLETQYNARTEAEFAVLDGKPSAACKGTKLTGKLFSQTRNESELGGAVAVAYTLKPSNPAKAPSSLTISGE